MAYLMGIDRGSTNVKAAIYDLRGQEICAASTPAEIPSKPHEGWAEQDMCRIWDNTVRSIRAVLQRAVLIQPRSAPSAFQVMAADFTPSGLTVHRHAQVFSRSIRGRGLRILRATTAARRPSPCPRSIRRGFCNG